MSDIYREKGALVEAIQNDGSKEKALEIVQFARPIYDGRVIPAGSFDYAPDKCYVYLKGAFGHKYVAPDSWVTKDFYNSINFYTDDEFRELYMKEEGDPKNAETDSQDRSTGSRSETV